MIPTARELLVRLSLFALSAPSLLVPWRTAAQPPRPQEPVRAARALDCAAWTDVPLSPSEWDVAYDGFGSVSFQDGLRMKPKAATKPQDTHAALVLLNERHRAQAEASFGIRVTYENVRPLRIPASSVQSWEVFWLFFNYRAETNGKRTNYFIHKPNGIELGTATRDVDQAFLSTAPEPQARFQQSYTLTLFREGAERVRASVDGIDVLDYREATQSRDLRAPAKTDETPRKALEPSGGRIGLYTEDSEVRITKFELCERLRPARSSPQSR